MFSQRNKERFKLNLNENNKKTKGNNNSFKIAGMIDSIRKKSPKNDSTGVKKYTKR